MLLQLYVFDLNWIFTNDELETFILFLSLFPNYFTENAKKKNTILL